MSHSRCLLCLALALACATSALAAVVHVKPGGDDGNSGADWDHAKASVNGAIAVAGQGDQVWVAAGVYYENVQNRIVGEQAVDVALYGGFAGGESALEERDIQANLTTLHGGGAGTVVTITGGAGPETRVDGFYITGGDAIHGGGIKMVASAPVIANNLIRYNLTDGIGAGISAWGFNPVLDLQPVISDNVIVDNFAYEAEGDGGGIGLVGCSAEISGNLIARNRASQNGGGICCWAGGDDATPLNCSPTVANNWILANSANILDGGSDTNYGGGGIFTSAHDMTDQPIGASSEPTIVNNVIGANGAWLGAGIELRDSISGAATVVGNTIVVNNGAGVHWFNTSPEIANNVVAYNTWGLHAVPNGRPDATLVANNVFGNEVKKEAADFLGLTDPTGTDGNISADPLLANHAIGEFHLQPGSPCIDAGSADRVVDPWPDVDGDERILGDGPDIGADESDGTPWDVAGVVIHVTPGGDDGDDGLTWAGAKATVAGGIQAAAESGGEVWVAAGTYLEHVIVPAFVHLYGGFAGSETAREQRDVSTNPTILDGGGTPTVVRSENAGYLVSTIDGFTIQNGGTYTGGDLMQIVPNTGRGAGLFSLVTGPVIANNTIRWNSVGTPFAALTPPPEGGGIAGYLSHAWVRDNTLSENEVLSIDGHGGGIWFKLSSPLIEGNLLSGNHAKYGAAVHGTGSSPRLTRNVIDDNAMYVWSGLIPGSAFGAVYLWLCEDAVVDANIFSDNVADQGAGLTLLAAFGGRVESNLFDSNDAWDYSGFGDGGRGGGLILDIPTNADRDVYVVNNTFVHNTATHSTAGERGGAIAMDLSSDRVVIANNVMVQNSSGIYQNPGTTTWVPQLADNTLYNSGENYVNLSAGAGDLILDPEFVDFAGGDYALTPSSRCIDTGDDGSLHGGMDDLPGAERVVDGDYDGLATVDRGAYERWRDRDDDGLPDGSDSDDDEDGVPDASDNCPFHVNAGQEDGDGDGLGDACDTDWDNDGVEQSLSDAVPHTVHGAGRDGGQRDDPGAAGRGLRVRGGLRFDHRHHGLVGPGRRALDRFRRRALPQAAGALRGRQQLRLHRSRRWGHAHRDHGQWHGHGLPARPTGRLGGCALRRQRRLDLVRFPDDRPGPGRAAAAGRQLRRGLQPGAERFRLGRRGGHMRPRRRDDLPGHDRPDLHGLAGGGRFPFLERLPW